MRPESKNFFEPIWKVPPLPLMRLRCCVLVAGKGRRYCSVLHLDETLDAMKTVSELRTPASQMGDRRWVSRIIRTSTHCFKSRIR